MEDRHEDEEGREKERQFRLLRRYARTEGIWTRN